MIRSRRAEVLDDGLGWWERAGRSALMVAAADAMDAPFTGDAPPSAC